MQQRITDEWIVTPEEYLSSEREAEFKSEYFDGQVYAMSGASPEHSAIVFNLYGEVGAELRGKPYRGLSNDTKIRSGQVPKLGKKGLFSYPDLTIVCGEPTFHDAYRDVLTNPKVIFEVLSPQRRCSIEQRSFSATKRLRLSLIMC